MTSLSVLLVGVGFLAGPKPCGGPAEPLRFLSSCKMEHVQVGGLWSRGIYTTVSFHYSSGKSLDATIHECSKEKRAKGTGKGIMAKGQDHGVPITDYGEVFGRRLGSISQTVVIRRRFASGLKPVGRTDIEVDETTDPAASRPAKWYRGAICAKPPARLIAMPFLGGRKADGFVLESFENLMSSAGKIFTERDAQCYVAYLDEPYGAVAKKVAAWAARNGYTKTQSRTYFRAGSGCFEFGISKQRRFDGRWMVVADMNVSDKKADHPIVMEKN